MVADSVQQGRPTSEARPLGLEHIDLYQAHAPHPGTEVDSRLV